ncbi:MAG TPA: lysylphosphatidylglycerol synthase domain-containing protein, partial [Puia sp.]|nr:lysylphosphatidylglycerol synthase domain-containing protein [Puia sp.]
MVLNKNIKLIVNYIAGPVIMFFLFYTVISQLHKQPNWKDSIHQMILAATGKEQWKLYCMFFLMVINWSLETAKWKIALMPIQTVSFFRALKAILAGTCIASFTPNRVGEYLGRMLFVDSGNKVVSVAPTILCSICQMLITLIAGSVGLFLYQDVATVSPGAWLPSSLFKPAIIITVLAAFIFFLVYFGFDPLVRRVNKWLLKNNKSFFVPDNYSFQSLSLILLLSVLRYLVFLLQYGLLFSLFGISLSGLQVFTGVSVMFVLMALVPTLTFLTDLGFRWAVGVQVFQVYTGNTAGILAVSLG